MAAPAADSSWAPGCGTTMTGGKRSLPVRSSCSATVPCGLSARRVRPIPTLCPAVRGMHTRRRPVGQQRLSAGNANRPGADPGRIAAPGLHRGARLETGDADHRVGQKGGRVALRLPPQGGASRPRLQCPPGRLPGPWLRGGDPDPQRNGAGSRSARRAADSRTGEGSRPGADCREYPPRGRPSSATAAAAAAR
jgi:hypothetical protein